jgi:hypothetical protein
VRQIDAGSTVGVVVGLRVAIGAGLLAVGWLVLGSVAGGASAAELEIGDGSLLGPDSSLAVVTEPIQDIGTDAGPSAAVSGADAAPVVAGLSILSDVADVQELVEPVVETIEPVLQSVEPVLETVEPVLESVEPVLQSVEPVLGVVEPVLESAEPVLEAVGVEATASGTQAESIQVAPSQLIHAPRDARSTVPSAAAVASADPAAHAPAPFAPFAPLAPLIPTETVAPGASGSTALPSDVAERGWVPCSPVAYTMPPGNDIPPAAPAFDSDSTPD